jgi:hypothetical protein
MISKKSIGMFAALFCFSVCLGEAGRLFAQDSAVDITAAQIIAKHLNTIAKPEVLSNMKNRGMVGRAAFDFVSGLNGSNSDGDFLCISEGKNIGLQMRFSDINYPGEYVAYNGKEVTVADITPGQKSPLGTFLFKYNALVKEGFLGGAMSVAWPFLNNKAGEQDFAVKREKIKGHDFYILEKMLGDIKVKLFFDAVSFRHQRTEYAVRIKGDISANKTLNFAQEPVTQSADSAVPNRVGDLTPKATIQEADPDTIYLLVEKFDDFIEVDKVVLPRSYGIEFTAEGHGTSVVAQWSAIVKNWMNNAKREIDQKFFVASILQPKSSASAKPATPTAK